MSVEKYKNLLESSFKDYDKIQEDHLNIMQTNQLPDLKKMTQERDIAFLNLKKNLSKYIEKAETIGGLDSLPSLIEFEGKLEAILCIDEKISSEIKRHRSRLQETLGGLKQGKNAMYGYKNAGKNPNKPCVLSMNQ